MSCEKRFDSAAVRVTTEVRQIHMWVVICSLCAIRKESGICVFAPGTCTYISPLLPRKDAMQPLLREVGESASP